MLLASFGIITVIYRCSELCLCVVAGADLTVIGLRGGRAGLPQTVSRYPAVTLRDPPTEVRHPTTTNSVYLPMYSMTNRPYDSAYLPIYPTISRPYDSAHLPYVLPPIGPMIVHTSPYILPPIGPMIVYTSPYIPPSVGPMIVHTSHMSYHQ